MITRKRTSNNKAHQALHIAGQHLESLSESAEAVKAYQSLRGTSKTAKKSTRSPMNAHVETLQRSGAARMHERVLKLVKSKRQVDRLAWKSGKVMHFEKRVEKFDVDLHDAIQGQLDNPTITKVSIPLWWISPTLLSNNGGGSFGGVIVVDTLVPRQLASILLNSNTKTGSEILRNLRKKVTKIPLTVHYIGFDSPLGFYRYWSEEE